MEENLLKKQDVYRASRVFYIIEAALEYFVSIMVGGVYLANVTKAIGMSDSLTGILSSFVSLGCSVQLLAVIFTNRRSVKKIVISGHVISQLLFALIYLTPFIPVPRTMRSVVLAACLLGGQFIHNLIHAPKINWFMNLIDDHKRGIFTANKEVVSLISGMLFTFGMGALTDWFEAAGNMDGAFITTGITVFMLCIGHTLTLVFSKEKTEGQDETSPSEKVSLKDIVTNKNLMKVCMVGVLSSITTYCYSPFCATYMRNELGFSMVLVSVLTAVFSLTRALFSRKMGKMADKRSFSSMLSLCFTVQAVGLLCLTFATPSTGKVFYTAYGILHAIGMAGINSGGINLIYDYVPHKMRTVALAFKTSLAGIVGFLTTLLFSRLLAYIQASGNMFIGMHVYAQQVLAFIGMLFSILTLLYLRIVVKKIHRT